MSHFCFKNKKTPKLKSVLLNDCIKMSILPSIDKLLDWRNRLRVLKMENDFPEKWYLEELEATDWLLSMHHK